MKTSWPRNLVEQLEPRLMLDGEWVGYHLELTNLAGVPISAIEVGQEFKLNAYVEDLRGTPAGVFAGYLDVTYDETLASPAGALSYGADYVNGQAGSAATPGLIDEAGAFAGGTPVGAGPTLLFSITLQADAEGTIVFASNPADVIPGHDTLVYGYNDVVSSALVSFGQATLDVLASVEPTAELAHPTHGQTLNYPVLNVTERYIDVTFTERSGSGLDAATITDAGAEFTLAGAAAAGVTVDGAATLVSGTTYRYTFTGDFADGEVTVNFGEDGFADTAGNLNDAASESFTLLPPDLDAPTAELANPADEATVGDSVLNGRSYIDVTFADIGGSGLNLSTITDAGAEFTLGGAGAAGVTVDGAGVLVSGTTYRYSVTGDFVPGEVTVDFTADSFADNAGNLNTADAQGFTVFHVDTQAPTAALEDPLDGAFINDIVINPRGYIDVTFADTDGSGLDPATITDAGIEFTLEGAAAAGVTVDGAAVLVGGTTYRYSFTGSFVPGEVSVEFPTGGFADLQGNLNAGATESFTVLEVDVSAPVADLSSPADGATIVDAVINARGYIDVTFADVGASGLSAASITDADDEFTLGGAAAAGVTVDGAGTLVSGTTYRYAFTGEFTPGEVTVEFLAGGFADNAGNTNALESESFDVELGIPEIAVTGDGQAIADGDTTPSAADDTDFGSADVGAAVTHTFTIGNSGNGPLSLTGDPLIEITGVNAADFTVTVLPADSVAAGGSTTFTVRFTPGAIGLRTATITILTDDADEDEYTFDVQGFGGRILAFGGKVKAQYTDANNDRVTVSLAGLGAGEVWFAAADPASQGDAERFVLTGTDTKSSLTVAATGGDKRTGVAEIIADGSVSKITAPGLDVHGDILIGGTLEALTLGDLTGPSTLELRRDGAVTTNPKAQLTFMGGVIADLVVNTNGQAIKSFSVIEWTDADAQGDDTIVGSWVGTLTTRGRKATKLDPGSALAGDFEAGLDLDSSRDDLSAKLPVNTLNSVKMAGDLQGPAWSIGGNVGTVTVTGAVATGLNITGNATSLVFGRTDGAQIDVGGSLTTLTLGDVTVPSTVDLHTDGAAAANPKAQLTLKGGVVADLIVNTHGQGVKSVSVIEWTDADAQGDDAIVGSWIGTLTTLGRKATKLDPGSALAGDFEAMLDLDSSRDDLSAKLPVNTLNSVKIAGSLLDIEWDIAGNLGAVTVTGTVFATVRTTGSMGTLTFGAADGADFFAGVTVDAGGDVGVTRHADSLADLDLTRTIKGIAIKGIKGLAADTAFFIDSNFSAGIIGAVSLVNAEYDAGGAGANAAERFGFWANAIKSVSHKNLANKLDSWTWPKQALTPAQVDLWIERLV